jgi:hypothetical protein
MAPGGITLTDLEMGCIAILKLAAEATQSERNISTIRRKSV